MLASAISVILPGLALDTRSGWAMSGGCVFVCCSGEDVADFAEFGAIGQRPDGTSFADGSREGTQSGDCRPLCVGGDDLKKTDDVDDELSVLSVADEVVVRVDADGHNSPTRISSGATGIDAIFGCPNPFEITDGVRDGGFRSGEPLRCRCALETLGDHERWLVSHTSPLSTASSGETQPERNHYAISDATAGPVGRCRPY